MQATMSHVQFRVRAVNKEGESEPLVTEENGFLAKNPYDVPGKVDKPELVNWDKDHVDLQWKAAEDGGSPIEEYVVEVKDKHGKWTEAMTVRNFINHPCTICLKFTSNFTKLFSFPHIAFLYFDIENADPWF